MISDIARDIERAVSALDVERLRRTYWEQDEFIHLEHWLPAPIRNRSVLSAAIRSNRLPNGRPT